MHSEAKYERESNEMAVMIEEMVGELRDFKGEMRTIVGAIRDEVASYESSLTKAFDPNY